METRIIKLFESLISKYMYNYKWKNKKIIEKYLREKNKTKEKKNSIHNFEWW